MLNYGVIGTNWITDWWIESSKATGKWKLAAVYSRKEDTAKAFADKHSISTTYTSIKQLVDDPNLQAIYIASPNSLHHEHATLALTAKKHVILEKPATSTPAELHDLIDLAKRQGVYLIEAFRHIQEANFHVLRRVLLEERRLGTLFGASLVCAGFSSRYNEVLAGREPNVFSLEYSGGSLVDIGIYPVSFALALFGKPKAQTYAAYICPTGADGGGFITLNYDGFAVNINQSKCYTSTGPTEFYGEKGTVTVNATMNLDSVKFWSHETKKTEEFAGERNENKMQEEAEEFARIINDKDQAAYEKLLQLSRDIIDVTSDLRRQNGIVYKAEQS